jgi:hypothetical protein
MSAMCRGFIFLMIAFVGVAASQENRGLLNYGPFLLLSVFASAFAAFLTESVTAIKLSAAADYYHAIHLYFFRECTLCTSSAPVDSRQSEPVEPPHLTPSRCLMKLKIQGIHIQCPHN